MHILLTGAAGFVGWKTAELLLADGHTVVGIDNLNDYYSPDLKKWRIRQIKEYARSETPTPGSGTATAVSVPVSETPTPRSGTATAVSVPVTHPPSSLAPSPNPNPTPSPSTPFTFIPGDLENAAFIDDLFETHRFDAVINLAARAGVRASIEDPGVYFRTNALGSVHLLEAMRRKEVKKYVLASTSSLYAGQPMPFDEALPVNTPISPYAASKKAAEVSAYTWHHLYGIDVTILRYFTVYGPAGRPDMSPLRFANWIATGQAIQLYGDGTQRRDFTYIDDIAAGTVAALKPLGFEIINLGGGNEPIEINTMIAAFEQHLGKKAKINHLPFHDADMKATQANNQKARTLLNWTPKTTPEAGFKKTIEWYQANQSWLTGILA